MADKRAMASSSRTTLDDEPSTDAHQALLTEHFGFHPRVFVDALVYAANEHLYSIGGQFEEFAKKQLKASSRRAAKKEREMAAMSAGQGKSHRGAQTSASALAKMTSTQLEAEAERGVHGVLTLLENALDHIFDLLELYCLKTVFGVKPSQASAVTLKHHRGLDLRTAEERVRSGEPLTTEVEGAGLAGREAELREKVEKARRMRHALRIANLAANRSLARANKVSEAFTVILGDHRQRLPAPLSTTTPQSARKLRVDAQALVQALDGLSNVDPLGASLIPVDRSHTDAPSERERLDVVEASGATDTDKRAWERGREAYINWEMDRIIRSVRTRGSDTDQSVVSMLFATPSKMDTSSYAPSGAKRRRTTRLSTADRDESEHQAAQIGELDDVEVCWMANIYRDSLS